MRRACSCTDRTLPLSSRFRTSENNIRVMSRVSIVTIVSVCYHVHNRGVKSVVTGFSNNWRKAMNVTFKGTRNPKKGCLKWTSISMRVTFIIKPMHIQKSFVSAIQQSTSKKPQKRDYIILTLLLQKTRAEKNGGKISIGTRQELCALFMFFSFLWFSARSPFLRLLYLGASCDVTTL